MIHLFRNNTEHFSVLNAADMPFVYMFSSGGGA